MTVAAALRAAARPLLVGTDLDGTIAALAPRPEQVQLAPGAREALARLAQGGVAVAVLSGRALDDLRRFDLPSGVRLVGSHGLERDDRPVPVVEGDTAARLDELVALGETAAELAKGAWLERKPAGVALHRRQAVPAPGQVASTWFAERASRLDGVWLRSGHEVVEAGVLASSKASALAALREECGAAAVVYFGDDRTDEEVFASLGPGDVGVKVGGGPTAAAHRVAGPPAVVALLEQLGRLSPSAR